MISTAAMLLLLACKEDQLLANIGKTEKTLKNGLEEDLREYNKKIILYYPSKSCGACQDKAIKSYLSLPYDNSEKLVIFNYESEFELFNFKKFTKVDSKIIQASQLPFLKEYKNYLYRPTFFHFTNTSTKTHIVDVNYPGRTDKFIKEINQF